MCARAHTHTNTLTHTHTHIHTRAHTYAHCHTLHMGSPIIQTLLLVSNSLQSTVPSAQGRVRFVDHSVHNSLSVLLDRPSAPPLHGATIQFPDPWAKTKTKRRRILQPSLAEMLVDRLEPGGFVYFSTDCAGVAKDMEQVMESHCRSGVVRRATVLATAHAAGVAAVASTDADDSTGDAIAAPGADGGDAEVDVTATSSLGSAAGVVSPWLPINPFGVPSERERVCGELGRPVYRALYYKCNASAMPIST
jgi:hypothetical protein